MSDSYSNPQQRNKRHEGNRGDDPRGGFRGGRGQVGREGGGFRIRLSDNEMRAARSIQEAFNLRSTVAVLGFAIRTLAQMLEEGKLEELVTQTRSQGANRREDTRQGHRRNRDDSENRNFNKASSKPNPFARPEKPQSKLSDLSNEDSDSPLEQEQAETSINSTDDVNQVQTKSNENQSQDEDNNISTNETKNEPTES